VHISEINNTCELAQSALDEAMGAAAEMVEFADQETGLDWRELT
jgi:hypothetical protein